MANSDHVSSRKSKGLSDESIKPPTGSQSFNHINTKVGGKFNGSCLNQEKVTYTHHKVINIYIVYEIDLSAYTRGANFTLRKSLSGAVNLSKNADFDKYKYFGYCVEFDACGVFRYEVEVSLAKML